MSKLIPSNRRNFVRNATVGTIAALTVPGIISSAFASAAKTKKVTLADNDVVLFQGDSITEWGRDKSKSAPNDFGALGSGYVLLTATVLLRDYAAKNLQVHNTGISGNKVYQLSDRWDADTLALKPNVLSIMVGVNDYWHTLSGNYKGTIETYKTDYKKLLERTKQALPDVKLIIGEPFALKDVKAVDASWYPAFDTYRQAAQDVADEFGAVFVPYQKVMDEALKVAPAKYWSIDGVHPSPAGASLMAEAWLKAVKG